MRRATVWRFGYIPPSREFYNGWDAQDQRERWKSSSLLSGHAQHTFKFTVLWWKTHSERNVPGLQFEWHVMPFPSCDLPGLFFEGIKSLIVFFINQNYISVFDEAGYETARLHLTKFISLWGGWMMRPGTWFTNHILDKSIVSLKFRRRFSDLRWTHLRYGKCARPSVSLFHQACQQTCGYCHPWEITQG